MFTNIFLLTGTIIGAGIFSLPFVLKALGIYFFLLLAFLALISIFLSLAYLEIIKKEKKRDQLPFYLKKYLGNKLSNISIFLFIFSLVGALTGYIMLVKFAIPNILYFLIPTYLILLLKQDLIKEIDDILTLILLVILLSLIYLGNQKIAIFQLLTNLPNPKLDFKNIVNSYGIILFSYTGFSVLPELNLKAFPKLSALISYLIVAIIYALFALTGFFANKTLLTAAIIFAILTSYIPLTLVLEETLKKDLSIASLPAKLLSLGLPLVFVLFGEDNFLAAFSITGGVFIALLQGFIVLAFLKAKKQSLITKLLSYLTLIILVLGAIAIIFESL